MEISIFQTLFIMEMRKRYEFRKMVIVYQRCVDHDTHPPLPDLFL